MNLNMNAKMRYVVKMLVRGLPCVNAVVCTLCFNPHKLLKNIKKERERGKNMLFFLACLLVVFL